MHDSRNARKHHRQVEEKANRRLLVWGLLIALVANSAAIGVAIWENRRTSMVDDLWFSETYLYGVMGAATLGFFVGLPPNVTALFYYWRREHYLKFMLALVGCFLSLSPWIMPVVVESFIIGW